MQQLQLSGVNVMLRGSVKSDKGENSLYAWNCDYGQQLLGCPMCLQYQQLLGYPMCLQYDSVVWKCVQAEEC
jgi:hypothetical protein